MTEWREVAEPKVWVSSFIDDTSLVSFNWVSGGKKITFVRAFKYGGLTPDLDAPKFIHYFRKRKIPETRKDAFIIVGGLNVISPAFRDVLSNFNIGQTQLYEVPICKDKSGTPTDLPNHFVMNVHAPKETLIPELSKKIWQTKALGEDVPRPGVPWKPKSGEDDIAVRADASGEFDMWTDPNLRHRFFLSDRLKTALDASGLKLKALQLKPARVFERV